MQPRLIAVGLMSTALLLVSGPAALAKDSAKGPPDQAVVVDVVSAVAEGTAKANVDSAAAAVYCRWARVERFGKNLLGMKLWSYFQKIDWCYNGSTVTSRSRLRWAEVHFPGWAFKGHIGSQVWGGPGSTYYRSWTQGHFCLAEYFSCVQNAYPWIDMTVRGNGTWSYTAGG